MSVEYEYVTIDVDIMSHSKACAAGVEAMGLWLWAMAWSHKNNADGRLPRHVIAIAWGASKQTLTKLAKSLVLAGLWVETPDGWEIWNYAKKNQLAQEKERRRAMGRERMKRLRERKSDAACDASPSSLVTSRDAHVICQDAAPDPDLISGSSSSERDLPTRSRSRATDPAPHSAPPVTATRPITPPTLPHERVSASEAATVRPPWFDAACDAVEGALVGETIERPRAWLRYHGHRTSPDSRKAMSQADAQYWLTTVDVAEARRTREQAHRDRERDASFKARFDKPPGAVAHEALQPPTAAQSKAFAEQLAARVAARRKGAA